MGIIRESSGILMDAVPADVDVLDVQETLQAIPGVLNVHHIHAWALTSGRNLFSAHIHIDETADSEAVLDRAREVVRTQFGFYFSTLQVEKSCTFEEGAEEIDITDE